MKLSKIGLVVAGIYLLISAFVIFSAFSCSGMFCGLVIIYPAFPEYLLITITGFYKSIADPLPLGFLFFPVSIAINAIWLYFVGSFVFGGGYKNSRPKIVTVFLFVLAALPIIIILSSYVYGKVLDYNYRKSEIDLNTNQKAQISLAKNSNITIEPGVPAITKINETEKNDEYELVTPLKINNIPEGLENYNIECKGASSEKDGYIASTGNYPDDINLNDTYMHNIDIHCGFLLARNNKGSWEFGVDTWNRTHKDSPELVSYLVLHHGESFPKINSLDISMYIPVKAEQTQAHAEPQGVSQEDSTILTTNLKINMPLQVQEKENLKKYPILTTNESASWRTYTDNKYGFSLKYPEDWKMKIVAATGSGSSIPPTIFESPDGKYEFSIESDYSRQDVLSYKKIDVGILSNDVQFFKLYGYLKNIGDTDVDPSNPKRFGIYELGTYKLKTGDGLNYVLDFKISFDKKDEAGAIEIFSKILSTIYFPQQ